MKRFILIAIAFLLASLNGLTQSFTVRMDSGEHLCFQVTDTTQRAVEIVRIKMLGSMMPSLPTGDLFIPSTIKYKNENYSVCSIGEAAFSGADGLKSVSIPSSVQRIGDRAFSGCSDLQSIIFPGNMPSIGENAFEKCRSLQAISFGSDWTSVDLQLFMDSESLKEVYIPARVNKITGVKKMASLERIEVDPNNKAFSSHDGMLYSKNGQILYACPCARSGHVSILPGTEAVLNGAIGNCSKIVSITLPASIHEFAYDEFSGCDALDEIVLLSEVPPMTAKWNGAAVFAIEAPNEHCIVRVLKEHLSRYKVGICSSAGVYEGLHSDQKAELTPDKMLDKSSLNKIKKHS